ncbi:MAG: tetratricopeptide repeat protein, partial [Myxococcaceae bacterium]
FEMVADESSTKLPRPVLLWVRGNERMLGVFAMLRQIEDEKKAIYSTTAWQGAKMREALTNELDQNRATLTQVAGQLAKNRLVEAHRNIRTYANQAEIIRFETSKAEKELFEQGVDQVAMLKQKPLYRPKMPAEDWNYWKFQGEFWIDEIGYYQYTLKNGCPAGSE